MAKLSITGGGRCNLTNSFQGIRSLGEAYPRGERVLQRALKAFSEEDTVRWFEAEGIPLVLQPDHCWFPRSQNALDIVRCLDRGMRGAELRLRTPVRRIGMADQGGYLVSGEPFDYVVVTTGGAGKGLPFLEGLGLELITPVPSLFTFTIQDGSYVEFTGDPMNPRLNLTATERTRAAVGGEGQSRSVLFDCGVVITKTLQDMGLEFVIDAPEDMAISSDLNAMTTEERGKLAVTMLTTGMYLADGNTSGFSMNSALSSFLQSEINNITGNALKTLDVSVGLDNSTDASGNMHTDYSFKFAKRFWNNRLSVQIGGKVSTGSEVEQGQKKSFFDNVTMEYRLTPTSNQYVKLFYNENVYDWLEGYTSQYGGGYMWKRKLDSFWDIFRIWGSENKRTALSARTGFRQQPADSLSRRRPGQADSLTVRQPNDTIQKK